jgi:mono/diheme cytochrome c family protein
MGRLTRRGGRAAAFALALAAIGSGPGARAADTDAVKRGEYLFHAAGCESCHTDVDNKTPLLAGGPAIKTPFGTFYGPNITPHPERGIGKWSDEDFIRALRRGVSPSGEHYFPVFPYTSFTNITDADLKDLKAYIFTIPASDRASRAHEIKFPFGLRFLQIFWQWLNFAPGPFQPNASKPPEWNRGAYLVKALVHCGECHTPRNAIGGIEYDEWLSGTADGPNGHAAPNITADKETGIGSWRAEDLVQYLATGQTPTGDDAAHEMAEVILLGTSKMTDADLAAIATYVQSLPPIRHVVGAKK